MSGTEEIFLGAILIWLLSFVVIAWLCVKAPIM